MLDWSLIWWTLSTELSKTPRLYNVLLKMTKNIWEIKEALWSIKPMINSNKVYNQWLISKNTSRMPEKPQRMHLSKRSHYLERALRLSQSKRWAILKGVKAILEKTNSTQISIFLNRKGWQVIDLQNIGNLFKTFKKAEMTL